MTEHNLPSVGVYTLGCKVNQYESRAIEEKFRRRGFLVLPHTEQCDVYVINTCTVTAEADRKARQFIRRAVAQNSAARIIVCGCLSQRDPEGVSAIPGVDCVLGNTEKLSAVDAAARLLGRDKASASEVNVGDVSRAPFEPMTVDSFERTRAYIKIEDGCESRCAYCVIPRVRGRIRSKPLPDVISEARRLAAAGYREIVLTGIEICSWGQELGADGLPELLEALDGIDGLERIRLGSLDPAFLTEPRIERLAALRHLAPHFHISIQSGCDRTLAAMRRKYNTEMLTRRMECLRRAIPDVTFTTDVMTGFPGETDADFVETCDFFRTAGFLSAHVFTYSRRPDTEADTMPGQVPEPIKIRRAAALDALCAESGRKICSGFLGRTLPVLFETFEDGHAVGHTPNYLTVTAAARGDPRGRTLPVRLDASSGTTLSGTIIEH